MRLSILIACLLLLGLGTVAEESPFSRSVRELGSPSFAVRQAARAALAEAGWEARRELEEARRHPDPEVADAARELLAEMLPGVTRDTPESQRRLVVRYVEAAADEQKRSLLRDLLAERPFPAALLLGMVEWERTVAAQAVIVQGMLDETPAFLGPLLEADNPALYERLLQWAVRLEMTAAIPRVAAYAWRNGRLESLREQAADLLATSGRPFLRRLLAELHLLAGAADAALETVATLEDSAYRQEFFARTGRWAELAAELAADRPNGPKLFQLAAAQRLAGQDELAAETLAGKSELTGEGEDNMERVWHQHPMRGGDMFFGGGMHVFPDHMPPRQMFLSSRRGRQATAAEGWRYALAYGLVGDTLAELRRLDQVLPEVDLLVMQSRYAEADRRLRDALAAANSPQAELLQVGRAGLRHALGDGTAEEAIRELLERCRRGEAFVASEPAFRGFLERVDQAGFPQPLAAFLPDLLGRYAALPQHFPQHLVRYLAPNRHRRVAWFWWGWLARAEPNEALAIRAARLRDFLAGQLDAAETDAILQLALDPEAGLEQRLGNLQQVASTCLGLGRQEEALAVSRLALRLAEEAEERRAARVLQARTHLVHMLFAGAQWGEAAAESASAWREGRELSSLALHGLALAWTGERAGADEAVERALALADPASPALLLQLLDADGWPEANRELLTLADRVARAVPPEALPTARRLGDYELEWRLAQRQWYETVVSPVGKTPGHLLQVNADFAFAECRARLAADGAEATLLVAKRLSDAFPFDIDGAADTVEALERAGFQAEADELTAHLLEREQALLDKLPDAVQHLNGYAWMCARTGRNLERGESYVRRALERVPENDAYLDTLAVILHRRGDLEGAIAAMRTCLRLKPHHHLYRRQLAAWLAEAERKP